MKFNFYSALAALASFFFFSTATFAQDPATTDSIIVAWEQLDGPPGKVIQYGEGGGKLWAGTESGLFSSSDLGKNWHFNYGLGKIWLLDFKVIGQLMFALTFDKEGNSGNNSRMLLKKSIDGGSTWVTVYNSGNDVSGIYINAYHKFEIIVLPDLSLMISISDPDDPATRYSIDLGETWVAGDFYSKMCVVQNKVAGVVNANTPATAKGFAASSFTNIPQQINFSAIQNFVPGIVRAVYQNNIYSLILQDRQLLQTTNFGATWTNQLIPVPDSIRDVSYLNGIFYLTTNSGVYKGDFLTTSFEQIYAGEGGNTSKPLVFKALSMGFLVCTDNFNTMFSDTGGQVWELRSKGLVSNATARKGFCGKLFATSIPLFPDRYSLYSSSNVSNIQDGEWKNKANYIKMRYLGSANGGEYFYGPPLMRTFDCGATLDTLDYYDIPIEAEPESIIRNGNRLILWNKFGAQTFYSDDFGSHWLPMESPEPFFQYDSYYAKGDTQLIFGYAIEGKTLYRTFNNGQNWESVPPPIWFTQVLFCDSTIVGITMGIGHQDLYISRDYGTTWIQTFSSINPYPYPFTGASVTNPYRLLDESNLLLQNGKGLFISSNFGISWTQIPALPFYKYAQKNNGAQNIANFEGADSYFIDQGYLYANTETQGVWRTPFEPIRDKAKVKSKLYGFLSGRLFHDSNGDCQFNSTGGDVPLINRPVLINPGNKIANTDNLGRYNIALAPGNYTITATAPIYHNPCTTDTIKAIVEAGNEAVADVPFTPLLDKTDLCLLITLPTTVRRGFQNYCKLQVSNIGTVPISGESVTFTFEPEWLEFVSIVPAGSVAGNTITIDLPTIPLGQTVIYSMLFNVLTTTPLGTALNISADCPVPNDENPANNTVRTSQVVIGSFDPNDKSALPIQAQPPGQPRLLDYLIRFQNTGNDTAFIVVVTDTIQEGLDLLSIRTVESSHPFEFSLLPGRVCQWKFRNILLPDSNTNEVNSHGYLRFQIETNKNLAPGTPIRNDADIFFDFNSPVRTNEATSDNPKWIVTYIDSLQLCAGDSWNGVTWNMSEILADTVGNAWSDTINIVNLNVSPVWELHLDTIVQQGALLFNQPMQADTTLKFILSSEQGCDSTIFWHVTVETSATNESQNQSLQFSLQPNPATQGVWVILGRNTHQIRSVNLLNAAGTLVRTWENLPLETSVLHLDVAELPSGIYMVAVQGELFHGIKRLVKM